MLQSHSSGRARWIGDCNNVPLDNNTKEPLTPNTPTTTPNTIITQELCNRLEKLNANS